MNDDFDPGQGACDTSIEAAGVEPPPPAAAKRVALPRLAPSRLEDFFLLAYADAVDDLERVRIATENRIRSLSQVKGMEGSPEHRRMCSLASGLEALEHQAILDLKRAMRSHPFGPWIKTQLGVGQKQAARLLAAIGDPYIDFRKGQPRTVSQLWAYCGYHVLPAHNAADTRLRTGGENLSDSHPGHYHRDVHKIPAGVAARRRKGQKANWNTTAKVRAFLIAESCIKHRNSPYRAVYDQRREHTASSHPEWTDGHSHNDALRVTAKEVLKRLWREGRRLEESR